MPRSILTINPGSTSTKIALFSDNTPVQAHEAHHSRQELDVFPDVWSQFPLRLQTILSFLNRANNPDRRFDTVVGRGGLLAPLPGGVFHVNAQMLVDLRLRRYGEHPCNLGAPLAQEITKRFGGLAVVVDPVVTDELCSEARLTGLPKIRRRSTFHALSQRGSAREAARRRAMAYQDGKFIVAHLGGGISIGAHLRGRVVDVTNALDGEGPMSPERTGALPVLPLLDLLERGEYDLPGMRRAVLKQGGLFAHLGTNDFKEIERRLLAEDAALAGQTRTVVMAFSYAIAKQAASMIPALVTADDPDPVDALVLTGGLAHSEMLTRELTRRLSWIGPIEVVLGLTEAQVMAESALAALRGTVALQEYVGNDFDPHFS